MAEETKKSEKKVWLNQKLFEFQKRKIVVKKDAKNDYYKSKYAPLDTVRAGIINVLNELQLLVRHDYKVLHTDAEWPIGVITTSILDVESEESIVSTSEISLKQKSRSEKDGKVEEKEINLTPQQVGSAITYYRRYNLTTLLNIIVEDEDDDGNISSNVGDTKSKTEKKVTPPKEGDNKKRMKELLVSSGKTTKADAEAFIKEFTGNVRDMENYTEDEAKEDLLTFYSKSTPTEWQK